ncbi:hypothetical protein BDZ89DRAFT_1145450 [Hymenopellis radicata]|nr:hypothetical protein BDZ89DRAFT_1145450 [Hymenopellis radicata]
MIASQKPSDSTDSVPGGFKDIPIDARRKDDDLGLRPVTIAQMHKALRPTSPGGSFVIDGVPVKMITFVACVLDIIENVTHKIYKVNDGNLIDARFWLDGNIGSVDDNVQVLVYARFIGYLVLVGETVHVVVRSAHKLEDYMEIDFHYLQCMSLTARQEVAIAPQASAAVPNAYLPAPKKDGDSRWAHLPALQRAIVELLAAQAELPDGLHVAGISKELCQAGVPGASDSHNLRRVSDTFLAPFC